MSTLALIVTDAGPLITLAVADALDALLLPRLPVVIPDMVRHEVIRDLSRPGAQAVADWIRAHDEPQVRVASTEVFEEYQLLAALRPATRTANRGELAAAEVLGRTLRGRTAGALLLFEDSAIRKQNFLVRLPDTVVVTSTSEFLFGLQSVGLLADAAAILTRATTLRGNRILERHAGGSGPGTPGAWPGRVPKGRG